VSYQIKTAPEVQKELKALPGYVRAQAYQMIDTLASNPRPHKAKELRRKPGFYRIWLAGRWRIVYSINDETQIVRIIRVRSKATIDYESL
jgi:mRNA-degrading endonuclease RelE of RelBE toxin-antitoxin system